MKYYIAEYWAMSNSTDAKTREEGKLKWNETAKKYGPYFESIKDKLPKKFLKEFNENSWFHDFIFEDIHIANKGKQIAEISFDISHDNDLYKITLVGVKGFEFNIPNTQYWMFGKLTWGYTEFELNDDGTWIIRILCDMECQIEILFKKINILKIKK